MSLYCGWVRVYHTHTLKVPPPVDKTMGYLDLCVCVCVCVVCVCVCERERERERECESEGE